MVGLTKAAGLSRSGTARSVWAKGRAGFTRVVGPVDHGPKSALLHWVASVEGGDPLHIGGPQRN